MTTRMETYTGRFVDLSRPDPDDICIEDIAWHLSRTACFSGATTCDNTYNVAQHSVLVMNRVKQTADVVDKPTLLTALLYSAPSAYMGENPAAMANLLDMRAPLQRLHERLWKAICEGLLGDVKFDGKKFEPSGSGALAAAIVWSRHYESYHMLHSKGRLSNSLMHLDDEYILRNTIVWPSNYAYDAFINHFNELLPASVKV